MFKRKKFLLLLIALFLTIILSLSIPVANFFRTDYGIKFNNFMNFRKELSKRFNLISYKPVEFDIRQIPFYLRMHHSFQESRNQCETGSPNSCAEHVLSPPGGGNLVLHAYTVANNVCYIVIYYDRNDKDSALAVKQFIKAEFDNIIIDLSIKAGENRN